MPPSNCNCIDSVNQTPEASPIKQPNRSRQIIPQRTRPSQRPAPARTRQAVQKLVAETALAIISVAAQNMPTSDMPTPKPTASTMATWRQCCLPNLGQK